MKALRLLALSAALLVPAATAHACSRHHCGIASLDCRGPVHFSEYHDPHAARLAITTQDNKVVLLLTNRVVAVQLSDHVLDKVDRKMRREREDASALGAIIQDAVFSSVRSVLRHSAECPLHQLRDAEYKDGRLVLTTLDGDHLFESFDVEDRDVMESFSAHDAREFVREFHRAKAGWN